MKKLLALIVLLSACAPPSYKGKPLSPFTLYYGTEELNQLASYKMVVIQPWAFTAPDVARLKENGTVVLGYISIGEDDELRRGDGTGPGGYASWTIDEYTGKDLSTPKPDGQPDLNPAWGSYYADPSDSRWQRHIHSKAKTMKRELGVDGLFVDTALVPENVFTADREKKMKEGVVSLVRHLKKWSGGGYLLVNNGWREFDLWKDKIDGIMIEINDLKEISKIKRDLDARSANQPMDVFALLYMDKADPDRVSSVCGQLIRMNLNAVLYTDNETGKALTTFPLSNCL